MHGKVSSQERAEEKKRTKRNEGIRKIRRNENQCKNQMLKTYKALLHRKSQNLLKETASQMK